LIGLVCASLIGFMMADHATGDSTIFPVPCNMTHESADYRTLDALPFASAAEENATPKMAAQMKSDFMAAPSQRDF
jgi:hypothetical protein